MIITRSPLRITLGGGGTDIPSYYQKHGGFCVAAAIDKYVYVSLHQTFEPGIILKYSKLEHVQSVDEVQHPIIREALKMANITDPHLEITSHADIPAGTGLGSSSSFTTALLRALFTYQDMYPSQSRLAEMACELEIQRLQEPIGKQDQWISALGGVRAFTFCPDGTVEDESLDQSPLIMEMQSHLLLFFTGHIRSASEAIKASNSNGMDKVLVSGYEVRRALESGDQWQFCDEINKQWTLKLERDPSLNPQIVEWRRAGLKSGAHSGKLVGAGGGGFLLFYASNTQRLRATMLEAGLKETRFKFDWHGTEVIIK